MTNRERLMGYDLDTLVSVLHIGSFCPHAEEEDIGCVGDCEECITEWLESEEEVCADTND